jgi:hypothetical protein
MTSGIYGGVPAVTQPVAFTSVSTAAAITGPSDLERRLYELERLRQAVAYTDWQFRQSQAPSVGGGRGILSVAAPQRARRAAPAYVENQAEAAIL